MPRVVERVYIPFHRLANLLGVRGNFHRVWIEQESEYLHVLGVLELEESDIVPEGMQLHVPGQYIDCGRAYTTKYNIPAEQLDALDEIIHDAATSLEPDSVERFAELVARDPERAARALLAASHLRFADVVPA